MNLQKFATEVHANAVAKGWYDSPRNTAEQLFLIESEIQEADDGFQTGEQDHHCPEFSNFDIEVADAVIRTLDLMEANCIPHRDMPTFFPVTDFWQATRPLRHALEALRKGREIDSYLQEFVVNAIGIIGWDAFWPAAQAKHKFNQSRPYKHGKKF